MPQKPQGSSSQAAPARAAPPLPLSSTGRAAWLQFPDFCLQPLQVESTCSRSPSSGDCMQQQVSTTSLCGVGFHPTCPAPSSPSRCSTAGRKYLNKKSKYLFSLKKHEASRCFPALRAKHSPKMGESHAKKARGFSQTTFLWFLPFRPLLDLCIPLFLDDTSISS